MVPFWFKLLCVCLGSAVTAGSTLVPDSQLSHAMTWIGGALTLLPGNAAALPFLKKIFPAAAALALVSLSGCHGQFLARFPDVAACGPNAGQIVGTVSQALLDDQGGLDLSSDGRGKLAQAAETFGMSTVSCLLEAIVNDWGHGSGSKEPEKVAAASRGQSALDAIASGEGLAEPDSPK